MHLEGFKSTTLHSTILMEEESAITARSHWHTYRNELNVKIASIPPKVTIKCHLGTEHLIILMD